jgi:uncharacterized glyoxalase superfamily protein PhnB
MSKTSITPHLCCRNAEEATEFYQKAFGAELLSLYKAPSGSVLHSTLSIDGALFFVSDEFPDHGGLGPQSLGGTPVFLHVNVPDCEAVFQRAAEAGCEVLMPLMDMFWGDRYGQLKDPYGHKWAIATTIRQVSPEELQQATASMGNM